MKKALIVEDNPVNQKVITHFLKRMNVSYDIANNGVEGVHCFKQNKYDIVFMDLMMPEMDGYDATKQMRQFELDSGIPAEKRTPIVAVTANISASRDSCLEVGMDDYLNKPIKMNMLKDALDKHVPDNG